LEERNLIEKIDYYIAVYIQNHIRNEKLGWWLSRINRGEVFFLVLVGILSYFFSFQASKIFICMLVTGLFAFVTDRLVLFVKKVISRKRPLLSVSGNRDKNPDMRHSFPSAHAANSMVVIVILILSFHLPPALLIFPVFAGIGRLLTLHHYLSDVIGGWLIGCLIGFLAFAMLESGFVSSLLS